MASRFVPKNTVTKLKIHTKMLTVPQMCAIIITSISYHILENNQGVFQILKIYKLTDHPTIGYAAEELKKYLRMMMPDCGDIKITLDPFAEDGFRLGLMDDFGLPLFDDENKELDDVVFVDCDESGGIISGANPRAVLLAVYEYLRQNGCRWLFPGVDGEFIPMRSVVPVKRRHTPSMRYRGECIEGQAYQD